MLCYVDNIAGLVTLNVDIDGTLQLGSGGLEIAVPVTTEAGNCSFTMQTAALTAASHTIKLTDWAIFYLLFL
jgi:hypothetical protein